MKRLSRGRSSKVQPVVAVPDGKRPILGRKEGHENLQAAPIPIPKSRNSAELHLKTKKLPDFEFATDVWTEPLSLPQNIPVAPETSKKVSRKLDGSPPLRSFLRSHSPAKSTMTRGRKSSFSSTSTLFESSSTVPITIVVTTPDEDHPVQAEAGSGAEYSRGPSIRKFRNDSTMSLPAINSPSILDRNFLMPPLNAQVDTRRMRKAREFEEIRHFLIGFLNTKGTQLPRVLRTRIMSVYGVTDGDLDPTIVAKFGGEGADLDEGIVLDLGLQGTIPTDLDHKKILELAFQSILPPAAPSSTQDIMSARRKRMAAPLRTASLYSVDSVASYSSVSSRMSLQTNSKSKQTLDAIISNRQFLQSTKSTKRPASLAPVTRTPDSRPASIRSESASFFRRRSLQVQAPVAVPEPKPLAAPARTRPQSLHRYPTDPLPTTKAARVPKMPPPAFNNPSNFSKSRHQKTESSLSLSSLAHRPAVSSQLARSPLTATFPPRPLSLVEERQGTPVEVESQTPSFSEQETEKEESPTDSPTESLDGIFMKSSWTAPVVPIAPVTAKKEKPAPKSSSSWSTKKASKNIPKPVKITSKSKEQPAPVVVSQTPTSPNATHNLTHKGLTRSEVSDMEKPFRVRPRRSSSTLDAVSPRSPIFIPAPSDGNESDSSGMVFPPHPAFAPLGTERSRDSIKVDTKNRDSNTDKWGNAIKVTVSEKNKNVSSKLKKEKKEKRGSIFGNLKRSLFGKA